MNRMFLFPPCQTPLFLLFDGLEQDSVSKQLKAASKCKPSEAGQWEDVHGGLSGTDLNQVVMDL